MGEIAGELAVHFEQARDLPRAVKYLRLAAGNAARRSANQEAIACLTRARQLIDDFDEPAPADVRIGLCEQLGLVLRSSGEMSVAASQFLEMAATGLGRRPRRRRGAGLAVRGERAVLARPAAVSARRRARRRLPVDRSAAPRARRRLCGLRAADLERVERRDAETCAQTAAITRSRATWSSMAFTSAASSTCRRCAATTPARRLTAQEGLRLAGAAADTYDALMCQFWHGWALLHMGAWGDMRTLIDESMIATERNGHRRLTLLFRLELAWLHEEAGEFEKARDVVRAGACRSARGRLRLWRADGTGHPRPDASRPARFRARASGV